MSCKAGTMCGSTDTSLKACYGKPFHQEFVGTKKNANGDNVSQYIGCTGDPPGGGRRKSRRNRNRKNKSRRNRKNRSRRN